MPYRTSTAGQRRAIQAAIDDYKNGHLDIIGPDPDTGAMLLRWSDEHGTEVFPMDRNGREIPQGEAVRIDWPTLYLRYRRWTWPV